MFCIYLRTNSDLCHLHHKLIGFYNRDEKCSQCGTDWLFKYSTLPMFTKTCLQAFHLSAVLEPARSTDAPFHWESWNGASVDWTGAEPTNNWKACRQVLWTSVMCWIEGSSPYRAVNTFHLGYKNHSVYVVWTEVAICSQINTKHINTSWVERKIVEWLTCWCIT